MYYRSYDEYKKLGWDDFLESYKGFIYSNAFEHNLRNGGVFMSDLATIIKELVGKRNPKKIFIERCDAFLQINEEFALSRKDYSDFPELFHGVMERFYFRELNIDKKWVNNTNNYVNKVTCSLQGVIKYGEDIVKKYRKDEVVDSILNKDRLESGFNLKEHILSKMFNLRDNETKKRRDYIAYYGFIKDDLDIDYEMFCKKFKTRYIRKKTLSWIAECVEFEKLNFTVKIGKNKYLLNINDVVLWNYFANGAEEIIKFHATQNGYPDGTFARSISELASQYSILPFCKDMMPIYLSQKAIAARYAHTKAEWGKSALELKLAVVDKVKKLTNKI